MKTFLTILISIIVSVSLSLILTPKNNVIKEDFITFKKTGQIALDEDDKLKIQSFVGNDLEMLGNNVIINAGNEFIELRVSNKSKIRIEDDSIYLDTDNLFINNVKYGK